jgi:7-cyano-7-deazaguanine synthase
MKCLVLLSGGMDSVTVLHMTALLHEVVGAVSFDYGSKHNAKEIPMAAWHAAQLGVKHDVITLDFVNQLFASDLLKSGGEIPDGHYADENMKRTVVPFRNGIMLAIACGLAESREAEALVIAAHSGDHAIYPDCRDPFMRSMAEAMQQGTYVGIKLFRPFIHCDKAEIVRRGYTLGVDYAHTWSCYKGHEIHCGTCGTCVERREAFLQAGVVDPTQYEVTGPLPEKP